MNNKIGLIIVLLLFTGVAFAKAQQHIGKKMTPYEKQSISDIRVVAEFSAIAPIVYDLGMSCRRLLYSGQKSPSVCNDFTSLYLKLVDIRKSLSEIGENRITIAVSTDVRYVRGISYWLPVVSVAEKIVEKILNNREEMKKIINKREEELKK